MASLSTYGDVVDFVRSIIKDPSASSRLASAGQMEIWANSAMAEISEHAEYIDYVLETNTSAGTSTVTFAGDPLPLDLWRVEIDDKVIYPITTRKLYQSSRTWQTQTGTPRWYYLDSMRTLTNPGVKFGLWPKANGAYKITAFYKVIADELDSDAPTDKVMLPLWAVPGLAWGILSRFYESESRMQNLKTAQFYRTLFEHTMERVRARSFSRQGSWDAYGKGRTRKIPDDFRNLLPAAGFPYP